MEKQKILRHAQLTWQLKSRTKWDLQGDSNTKFFHAVASGKRLHNMIWSLEDSEGVSIKEESALKEMGKNHFSAIFKDEGGTDLVQQLKVVSLFKRLIPPDQTCTLSCSVDIKEIELSLHSFKRDRSPGPDGWPVEF